MRGFGRKHNRRLMPTPRHAAWAWFLGAFFTVGALLAGSFGLEWMLDPKNLPIREVRVDGEFRRLSPAHLQQVVAAEATGGFFSVDVEAIRAALMSDPWVREVIVRRVWPDALAVTVLEQRAIAYWGDDALINEEGRVFHPHPSTFPAGLFQLRGPPGGETVVLDRYRQLSAWFKPLGLAVASVELSPRRAWGFHLAGGPRVVVGRSDFESRVRRFIDTLPQAVGARVLQAEVVDLRYTNGFAVRLRAEGNGSAG